MDNRSEKPKIIGGIFGRNKKDQKDKTVSPPFIGNGKTICFSHARGGISWLVSQLEPDNIWLPSYLCPSMLGGLDNSSIRFFAVDDNLEPVSLSWIENINDRDLVCVIDYFGREWGEDIKYASQEQGAWVLEDACQALLTDGLGKHADFLLYSPRKFIGVPDGGILVDRRDVFDSTPELDRTPADWWIPQLNAWICRGQFDRKGANSDDRSWYQLYCEAKKEAPSKPYSMSKLSKKLIRESFDYTTISEKRKKNYNFIMRKTKYEPFLRPMRENEVPLGFVIKFEKEKERKRTKEKLIKNYIYTPIHWELKSFVPKKYKSSHILSKKILTIPCDQRYNRRDMSRVVINIES